MLLDPDLSTGIMLEAQREEVRDLFDSISHVLEDVGMDSAVDGRQSLKEIILGEFVLDGAGAHVLVVDSKDAGDVLLLKRSHVSLDEYFVSVRQVEIKTEGF